jgi:hypothetical protein
LEFVYELEKVDFGTLEEEQLKEENMEEEG